MLSRRTNLITAAIYEALLSEPRVASGVPVWLRGRRLWSKRALILKNLERLEHERLQILPVEVISKVALGAATLRQIEIDYAKRFTKMKISLENIVDPNLKGGVKIKTPDTQTDATLDRVLIRLKQHLGL